MSPLHERVGKTRYDSGTWWEQAKEEALKDYGIALYLENLKAQASKGDVPVRK